MSLMILIPAQIIFSKNCETMIYDMKSESHWICEVILSRVSAMKVLKIYFPKNNVFFNNRSVHLHNFCYFLHSLTKPSSERKVALSKKRFLFSLLTIEGTKNKSKLFTVNLFFITNLFFFLCCLRRVDFLCFFKITSNI